MVALLPLGGSYRNLPSMPYPSLRLKKVAPLEWIPKVEAALEDLKRYLSSPLILVAPKPKERLLLYVAATNQMVSSALVVE